VKTVPEPTLLPHVNEPDSIAHSPFEVVSVNPLPDVVGLYVAKVCVDHVPFDNSPPSADPEETIASTVKRDGTGTDIGDEDGLLEVLEDDVVGDVVVEEVVDSAELEEVEVEGGTTVLVVGAGLPVFVAYSIPLSGQLLDVKRFE